MREIKFRCWNTKNKSWYDFNENFKNVLMATSPWVQGKNGKIIELDWDNCIPMQYTGLKDKNGKEIYEGDIVRNLYSKDNGFKDHYSDDNVVIEWNTEYAKFGCGDFTDLGEAYNDQDTTLEVIGNIMENKDLLK